MCRLASNKSLQIKEFAMSLGVLANLDKVDAKRLARYVATMHPRPRHLPNKEVPQFNTLVTRRCQLIDMIASENNCTATTRDKIMRQRIHAC